MHHCVAKIRNHLFVLHLFVPPWLPVTIHNNHSSQFYNILSDNFLLMMIEANK